MENNVKTDAVAVLYQATKPPVIDGIRKPMKPTGYSDSGADIAFVLRSLGIPVVTPTPDPDPMIDRDWVFPDTAMGIEKAISAGAKVLWANTILFKGHALEQFLGNGVRVVGQLPEQVHKYDDKWTTNEKLRAAGCPVARSILISIEDMPDGFSLDSLTEDVLSEHRISFPVIIKPLRGRGSQGVVKIDNMRDLQESARALLSETVVFDDKSYLKYGNSLILEEYLPSNEVTITVMPPGLYDIEGELQSIEHHWSLPPVERFNHVDGITPYNGVVAVIQNSTALHETTKPLDTLSFYCAVGAWLVDARAPIRVDCRAREDGEFAIFDLNMKPNMTGSGRPGRDDQDSLSCMAARVIGWTYGDLLVNMLRQAWQVDSLPEYRMPQVETDA